MNRPTSRLASRLLCIVCMMVSMVALVDRAAAVAGGLRRHNSSGTAQFTGANTFEGSGRATHLGRYTEAGTVSFTPTSDPAVLQVAGSIVYTASNGDELHATVTYVGCNSGRFAAASGTASLTGQVQTDGTIAVTVNGTIDY